MNKIITNHLKYGGLFNDKIDSEFNSATHATIASGYISIDVLRKFKGRFLQVARKGSFKLMVGMAFYEGLTSNTLKLLREINEELQSINSKSGIYVCFTRRFHGKVYCFQTRLFTKIYVGSSNFSITGLSTNLECTISVEDKETKKELQDYLSYIFSTQNAVSISKAPIKIINSIEFKKEMFSPVLTGVSTFNPKAIDLSQLPFFEINLRDIVTEKQQKSNLNPYFGKGRENKNTGKITPRPWYEVELVARIDTTYNELYPIGNFDAYTDDGFVIPMSTQGDYDKNIRSQNSLQTLGKWLKGKLQRANALIPLTPVTEDVLDKYGNDSIKFYKIEKGKYFMQFLPQK